jgi:hypothetical protein
MSALSATLTLVMPMAEMGQGVYTALSMLLAEELEVGLEIIVEISRQGRGWRSAKPQREAERLSRLPPTN